MAISEICNALLITFIATEYSMSLKSKDGFSFKRFINSKPNQFFLLITLLINAMNTLVGAASVMKQFFEQLMHFPKVMMAALMYVIVLYVDCVRHSPTMTHASFLEKVAMQFLKILPVYPFLAVIISFVFMIIVTAFENLRLPFHWLNWPVYYGTLYGPFSIVYFQVKKEVCQEKFLLPIQDPSSKIPYSESSKNNDEEYKNIRNLRMLRLPKKG
mmetsp:Transcript_31266/g.47296  ORF Transcript_31266/g.47296 Transcript_31266/m.47296 type:complete len:215 (+) Transcript_31266:45-689(+)